MEYPVIELMLVTEPTERSATANRLNNAGGCFRMVSEGEDLAKYGRAAMAGPDPLPSENSEPASR